MLKKKGFIGNASVYVVGSFIQRAAEFLLIPLWTRFLTVAEYGIVGTMNAYAGVFFVIMNLSFHSATVRFYYDHQEDPRAQKENVTSAYLFTIVFGFFLLQVFSLAGNWAWEWIAGTTIPFYPFGQLMLWIAYLRTWIQIPLVLYQAQQKPQKFVLLQYLIFGSQFVMAMILVVGFRWGARGYMISQVIAAGVTGLVSSILILRSWFIRSISWKYIGAALKFSLPLVPHGLASWALNAAGRVILQRYASLTEVGLYNTGYTIGMAMQVLVFAINQAWSPYYYQLMQDEKTRDQKVVSAFSVYFALVGGVCLAAALFAGEVITLILPEKYSGGIPFVGPVMLGYLFLGVYYFAVMPAFYYKKTLVVPLITGAAGVASIGLNLVFVPRYGAISSAWLTTLTYVLLAVLAYVAGQRYHKVAYPFARLAPVALIILAGIVGANQIPFQWNALLVVAKLALLGVYAVVAYWLLVRQYYSLAALRQMLVKPGN